MEVFGVFDDAGNGMVSGRANWEQRPSLRHLKQVVAIAQSISRGHITITLFSLEAYDDGFTIEGRRLLEEGHPFLDDVRRRWEKVRRNIEAARAKPDPRGNAAHSEANHRILSGQPVARFELIASDDRGIRYKSKFLRSSGGTNEQRFCYSFAPALDPAAQELTLEVPYIRWLVEGERGERWVDGDLESGPWSFVLSLPVDNL